MKLLEHSRLGIRLSGFTDREVRCILAGDYAIRYESKGDMIYLLRI